jgi:hypothetical protein
VWRYVAFQIQKRLLFIRLAAFWLVVTLPASASCLAKKDAKRVEKARNTEKRLLIYVSIARRSAGKLWGCLSPMASTWQEGSDARMRPTGCEGVESTLAVLDCVDQGIADQFAALQRNHLQPVAALRWSKNELELAASELAYAEVDARRPSLGLGPAVPNQIKAERQALEDLETTIAGLLEGYSPTNGNDGG